MKREEYKEIIRNWFLDYIIGKIVEREDFIVDKIYDDFESRTCGNCKYFTECEDGFNYCDIHSRLNGFVTHDFGCNKFDRKGE